MIRRLRDAFRNTLDDTLEEFLADISDGHGWR